MKEKGNSREQVRFFLGEYDYTVDAQNRIAIPKIWRGGAEAESRYVLLPGREQMLQLIPEEAFNELLLKARKVSFADRQGALGLATIGALAQHCLPDGQGRISLSPRLKEHAGIGNGVILVGAVTTIQIWQPETWRRLRLDSSRGLDIIQAIQEQPDDFTDILRKAGQAGHGISS